MLSAYPACFFEENNGYSVIFPDLNYLSTCGNTIAEALEKSVDCLAGYLFEEKIDGNNFPSPSPISAINLSEIANELDLSENNHSFVNIVTVDVEEYAKAHFYKSCKKH